MRKLTPNVIASQLTPKRLLISAWGLSQPGSLAPIKLNAESVGELGRRVQRYLVPGRSFSWGCLNPRSLAPIKLNAESVGDLGQRLQRCFVLRCRYPGLKQPRAAIRERLRRYKQGWIL